MEDNPVPDSCYLHLSKMQWMERWQEFKVLFEVDEFEVVQRPMRDAL